MVIFLNLNKNLLLFEQSYIIFPDYLSVAMLVQVAVALVVVANLRRI